MLQLNITPDSPRKKSTNPTIIQNRSKQQIQHVNHTYEQAPQKPKKQQADPVHATPKQVYIQHSNPSNTFTTAQQQHSAQANVDQQNSPMNNQNMTNIHPMVQKDINYLRVNHLSINSETNSIRAHAGKSNATIGQNHNDKIKQFNDILDGKTTSPKHKPREITNLNNPDGSKKSSEDIEAQFNNDDNDNVTDAVKFNDKRTKNFYFEENQNDQFKKELEKFFNHDNYKHLNSFMSSMSSGMYNEPDFYQKAFSEVGNYVAHQINQCDWIQIDGKLTLEEQQKIAEGFQAQANTDIPDVTERGETMKDNDAFDAMILKFISENQDKDITGMMMDYLWCNIYDINDKIQDAFNSYKISKNYQLKYMFYSLFRSTLFSKFFSQENLRNKDKSQVYFLQHYYSLTSPIFNEKQNEQAFSLNIIKKLNKISQLELTNITQYRNFLQYYLVDQLHDYFNLYLKKRLVFKSHTQNEKMFSLQSQLDMFVNDQFNKHENSNEFDMEFVNVNKGYFLVFYQYAYLNLEANNCHFDKTIFLDLFTQAQQVWPYDFATGTQFTLEFLLSQHSNLNEYQDMGGNQIQNLEQSNAYLNNNHLRTLTNTQRQCFWQNFNKLLINHDQNNVNKQLTKEVINDPIEIERRLKTQYYLVNTNLMSGFQFENILNKNDYIIDSDLLKYLKLITAEMQTRINIKNKLLNPLPHNFFFVQINQMETYNSGEKSAVSLTQREYLRIQLSRHQDEEELVNLASVLKHENKWDEGVNNVFKKVELMTLSAWYSEDKLLMDRLSPEEINFLSNGFTEQFNTQFAGFVRLFSELDDNSGSTLTSESISCIKNASITLKILIMRDKGYNFSCTSEFTSALVWMYWKEMGKIFQETKDIEQTFAKFQNSGMKNFIFARNL